MKGNVEKRVKVIKSVGSLDIIICLNDLSKGLVSTFELLNSYIVV